MRWLLLLLAAAGLALLGWGIHLRLKPEAKESQARAALPAPVKAQPVQVMEMANLRTFTGTLRAGATFIVAPKVGGQLLQVAVNVGEQVRRGQMVAQLENAEYLRQIEQASAELEIERARIEQCKARLDLGKREFERTRTLYENRVASRAVFDTAESELRSREAELKVLTALAAQKEAALRASEVRFGYTKMEANWESGSDVCYVGQRFVDEGEMLAPNTPVLSVVDIRNLKAVIHVIERDYPHLVVGQKATIRTDAYPGTVFEGEVLRISKVLKEASRHAEVEIDVDNENLLLRPGMYVRVEIVLSEKEDAVAIPRDALVVNRGKTGVFQLSDEGTTVRWVPIETGIESRDWIEVTSPDIGGGRVVTLGQQLLRDGAAVVVPDGASEPREKTKNP